jgi:microcystin-dependent protein
MATFPTGVASFPAYVLGQYLYPKDVNAITAEIAAVEDQLLNGVQFAPKPRAALGAALGATNLPWSAVYLRAGQAPQTVAGAGTPSASTLPAGSYQVGDFYVDTTHNTLYVCTGAGTQNTAAWTTSTTTATQTFTAPVVLSMPDPALSWQGSESGAVQCTVVEIAGVWYWVQNAAYNTSTQQWSVVNQTLPARGARWRSDTATWERLAAPASSTPFASSAWTVVASLDDRGNDTVASLVAAQATITGPMMVGSSATPGVTLDVAGAVRSLNMTSQNPFLRLTAWYTGSGIPGQSTLQPGSYGAGDHYWDGGAANEYVCQQGGTNSTATWLALLPTGAVVPFAGATAPAGWLMCDGHAVSRQTYASLFSVIGTTYGSGDGSTTFNLPDLRSCVVVGAGQGPGLSSYALGSRGGEETHTLTVAEMPAHAHAVSDPGHAHGVSDLGHTHGVSDPGHAHTYYEASNFSPQSGSSTNCAEGVTPATTSTNGTGISIETAATGLSVRANTTGLSMASTGGGGAHNNIQPYCALAMIIKT